MKANKINYRKYTSEINILLLLSIGVFLFYWATLAPTVLWGDDAQFQRVAYTGVILPDGSAHWLWIIFARFFATLPIRNVAYRVNLLSAVAATGTASLIYITARTLKVNKGGAIIAMLSLAVSHTFWTHAVRAEVYTLFTFFVALQLFLWFYWQPNRPLPVFVAVGLLGVMLLSHQMTLLIMPAFSIHLWQRRHYLKKKQWGQLIGAFIAGIIPFFIVIQQQIGVPTQNKLPTSLYLYFTHAGTTDFGKVMLDYSLKTIIRDTALWLGFLGLQFVGIAGLLGIGGLFSQRKTPTYLPLFILYITVVAFAFSYHVNDQFVFYLPSYLPFTLFIGAGWQKYVTPRLNNRPQSHSFLVATTVVAMPILAYIIMPKLLISLQMNPMGIRDLPGREPNTFFLLPSKRGYEGASDYGRSLLNSLPPNSIVIADHTPFEPLSYLQSVENIRPDVRLIKIETGIDLKPIINALPPNSDIYLADNNPDYYNLQNMPSIRLIQKGFAYKLNPN